MGLADVVVCVSLQLRHVDLSYNHITLTQCDTLAAYLTENITLLGRHLGTGLSPLHKQTHQVFYY